MKIQKQLHKILYEVDDGIATATINFPERMNALGAEVRAGLLETFNEVEEDNNVRVLILTGTGRAFCVGADFKEMGTEDVASQDRTAHRKRLYEFFGIFRRIETLPKPVIAAVNGYAVAGGTEITLSCDFVIASEQAKFGTPEPLTLGVPPGWAAIRLAPLIGSRKAKEIILLRNQITAAEALQYGLVNKVVPHEKLMEAAKEMAGELLLRAPMAVSQTKLYINSALREWDITLAIEGQGRISYSEDRKEAINAFNEKRKPVFKGK